MKRDFFVSVSQIGSEIFETRRLAGGGTKHIRSRSTPALFQRAERPDTQLLAFPGDDPTQGLGELKFPGPREMRSHIETYKDFPGVQFFGMKDPVSQYIYENYRDLRLSEIDLSSLRASFFDIEVFSVQEDGTESGFPSAAEAGFPVSSVCQYDAWEDAFHVFALCHWDEKKSIHSGKRVSFHEFKTEAELLAAWLLRFCENRPDILCGYNSRTFDVPYLVGRISKVLGPRQASLLSPFKKVLEKKVKTHWGEAKTYEIVGIVLLDYMQLIEKYYLEPVESVSLDFIGEHILGLKKTEHPGSLNQLFMEDPQAYIDYNIRDVEIVKGLEEKLGYISYTEGIAYTAKINLSETMSPVRIWNALVGNRLMDKGIAPPLKLHYPKLGVFPGAYVFAQPGFLKQVASFDFTSLYPSIIRSLNDGYDTILPGEKEETHRQALLGICSGFPEVAKGIMEGDLVDVIVSQGIPKEFTQYLKDNQISVSASMNFFDTSRKSVFGELVDEMFEERKKNKETAQAAKKKLKDDPGNEALKKAYSIHNVYQGAFKVCLNSLYGGMSAQYFNYSDIRMAKSVTLTGQALLKLSIKVANAYINKLLKNTEEQNYVLISDTDSIYIELSDVVERVLGPGSDSTQRTGLIRKISEALGSKKLAPAFSVLAESLNFYQNSISMKRELICAGYGSQKASGLCASMKHYALWISDEEGYAYEPGSEKQKIMGLHSKQRGCPKFLKGPFNHAVKLLVMEGLGEARKYIKTVRDGFFSSSLNTIAMATSVSEVEKFKNPKTGLPYATEDEWWDPALEKPRKGGVAENARAAINYNYLLGKLKLGQKYEKIKNGDRLKILHLKENPWDFSVIGFKETLPPEFKLGGYVDYEKHYSRLFFKPLDDIFLKTTGEGILKKSSLADFF
jgi:DNA polymerase elongation subunit (family B)